MRVRRGGDEMITRRRLISAGSALAGGFGLIGESPAIASAVPWTDLADAISGTIVLPGDSAYLGLATPAALNYLQVSPRAVCLPHSAKDISTIIAFAREQRIGLRVRGGGHSYAGYSTTDGIQLDLSGMRGCSYDARTETVDMQGGVRGIDAASVLERTQRWIPAGNCPGVGIAGFVQGGGFGFYMGEAGLGCDNLVEAELVTASGTTVIASEQGAADLLWALRGGGGGNFGVISRLRLRTFTTERPSSVCMVIWRGTPPNLLIARLRDMIEGTGDELTWHFTCDATSPYNIAGSSLPQVTLLCHGFTDATRIVEALAPVVAAHPPALSVVRDLPFWDSHRFLSGNHLPENGLWYVKSLFLPGPLRPEAIEVVAQAAAQWPGSSIGRSGTGLIPWKGRATEAPAGATAFVHRESGYLAVIQTCWGNRDPASVIDAGRQWAERTYAQLSPFSTGGSYQNWIDPNLPDPAKAYYGSNLPRLAAVKLQVDPTDFFSIPGGVPRGIPGGSPGRDPGRDGSDPA